MTSGRPGQAKTTNALFALELHRRGAPLGVRALSLHPAVILTDIARHLSEDDISSFDVYDEKGGRRVDPSRDFKTLDQGAATSVWAAIRPELDVIGGVYCEDCDVAQPQADAVGAKGIAPWAMVCRPLSGSGSFGAVDWPSEALKKGDFEFTPEVNVCMTAGCWSGNAEIVCRGVV